MVEQLATLLTDIEFFIQDIRTFKTPDDEIDKKLDSFQFQIDAYLMDKSIQKDLAEGKKVFGQMRNPKTGQIEEVSHTGVICQSCGGHWLWGLESDGKTFFCPKCSKRTDELVLVDEEKETLKEQAERIKQETAYEEEAESDERVKVGLKSGREAYGY